MAKAPTKSSAALEDATLRRLQDIGGLTLMFAGTASLVCLTYPQHAPIPNDINTALRLVAGKGAYVIACLVVLLGLQTLRNVRRIVISHSMAGGVLLFLSFIAEQHLQIIPGAQLRADMMQQAGGYLGGLIGYPLYVLLQRPLSYMLLLLLALCGLVLIVDQPVAEIAAALHRRSLQAGSRLFAARPRRKQNARNTQAVVRSRVVKGVTEPPARQASLNPPDAAKNQKRLTLFNLGRTQETETEQAGAPAAALPKQAVQPPLPDMAPAAEQTEQTPIVQPVSGTPKDDIPFKLPPITLLKEMPAGPAKRSQQELTDNISKIEQTLEQFNIGANVVEVASGPSVTRYEIQLAPGIKVSKIVSLADNLAMSLAAIDVRVEAPIPGKSAIGVEVPNAHPVPVTLRECLENQEFRSTASPLTVALGKDVSGAFRYADLTRMPHLLIGGSTNSGKSVCLNTLIASLVYRNTPGQVRMVMIDPKRVELSLWDGIPHLMYPVIKDVKQAAGIFRAALREMDRRYDLFASVGTRNLDGYNQRAGMEEQLPYIVIIVDELADLMMQQGPEIEGSICRLAQLARATGIHLVIATQRPSVDIITGTIKANISSRIAFAVASQVDSRTILDMPGADRLIGRGDMLFMPIDASKPVRIQGCYLSEEETHALADYLRSQEKPVYSLALVEPPSSPDTRSGGSREEDVDEQLMEQAVRLVVNNGQASTSMLQRRFRIGYTRAARIVEMMEERGIVGPLNGARPREILISRDDVEQMFRREPPSGTEE